MTTKSKTVTKNDSKPVSARTHRRAVGDAWIEGYREGWRDGRHRGLVDGIRTARIAAKLLKKTQKKNAPAT